METPLEVQKDLILRGETPPGNLRYNKGKDPRKGGDVRVFLYKLNPIAG